MNAILLIGLASMLLLAVFALVTSALNTFQAWHWRRVCRRETQAARRFHEDAARQQQVVRSLAEWKVR